MQLSLASLFASWLGRKAGCHMVQGSQEDCPPPASASALSWRSKTLSQERAGSSELCVGCRCGSGQSPPSLLAGDRADIPAQAHVEEGGLESGGFASEPGLSSGVGRSQAKSLGLTSSLADWGGFSCSRAMEVSG